ncbi:MAG: methyltransferase [Candidatus Cloacimonetes bacterium]|nr:methyltransferase [Candidatus Cloacimonadota bacterium]
MRNKLPVNLPFGKTIYQTRSGHSITTDTEFIIRTILQKYRTPSKKFSVLELGSGNGIISIMLAHYCPEWQITGIEIQSHYVSLSKENAKLVDIKTTFIEADLKQFTSKNRFDLIVSNPPYFPKNKGRINPDIERAISRHEILCTMEDVLNSVKRNLKTQGKAYLLYPETRLNNIIQFAKKVDLKVTEKFILNASKNKNKILVELINAED